jgi:hypothetical protein
MPLKIYLCDTSSELADLRSVLVEQIQKAGMTPIWLSDQEKQSGKLLAVVEQKAKEADAFLSIVTYLRGWEPENMGSKSLAEIEYGVIRELGKPAAIFLPDSATEIGMYLRMRALGQAQDASQRQQTFWQIVAQTGTAYYFRDEADLTKKIADVLIQWATTLGGVVSTQTEVASPALNRNGDQEFFPADGVNIEAFAERVAQKTAERVDALQRQRQQELAEQALKYKDALELRPGELVFGRPAERSQFQADIFIIMPFKPEFDSIYTDVIRPLVKELNLTISRGDEFTSAQGVIMGEVWSALNNCKFVIAEITGGNDNVFYELGIAHTLNKPALMITQAESLDDIPFDIRHLRYIRYANTVAGGIQLRQALKTSITRLLADLAEEWGKPSQ